MTDFTLKRIQGELQPGGEQCLMRIQQAAQRHGITPLILGDAIEGESREAAVVMAGIARSVKQHGQPLRGPALLLSGGETTVTVKEGKAGRGGRNTEFLLSLACALIFPDTLARGRAAGLDAAAYLSGHDRYSYFAATGDLLLTGPTLTNVNDIRAILIN